MLLNLNIKISLKLKHILCVFILLNCLLFNNNLIAQSQKFKIILDAGHGGKDPGTLGKASYKKSYESDIALKVSLAVGKLLANHNDIKTIYTRKTDVFIPLHKRGSIANKADADLFISIHCNAAVTNAYGTTTYVLGVDKSAKNLELSKRENDVILLEDDYEKHYDYDPNSEEFMIGLTLMQEDYQDKSIEFAQIVQNKFTSVAKRKNRGVNQGNLAVLYDSYMPSVLIEIGFLSNKIEEKFLHTKTGQQKIAKAIYEAIKVYKRRIDNNSVYTETDNNTVVETVVSEEIPENSSYYTVQIATSNRKINTEPNNFKKLANIERKKYGSTYKYFYGKKTSRSEIKKLRRQAVKLGYKDAFVKRMFNKTKTVTNPKPQNNLVIKDTESTTLTTAYTIQIATSKKKIALKFYNFKGLKNVTRQKIGSVYKYFYGNTTNKEEAFKLQEKVLKLNYKGAFVKEIKQKIIVKKPTVDKPSVETSVKTNAKNGIVFKVQVTSGKRKLAEKAYNFRGLQNIERIKIGSYYKYYYGKTSNYNLILKKQKDAVAKGYTDALIVAIKNNKLVSVKDAIK